jgi:hypothetical protein
MQAQKQPRFNVYKVKPLNIEVAVFEGRYFTKQMHLWWAF